MGFLSKEDFSDLSNYKALSAMDCLALVASKAWDKEQRGKSKVVVDETLKEFRVQVRGFLFQEPKIEIPMQENTKIPYACDQSNKGKGVVKPPKRARNNDDYEPGPLNRTTAMQPKIQKKDPRGRPQYHDAYFDDGVKRIVIIPEDVKNKVIAGMNGTELKFVIEKKLTTTDLKDGQNRLSMPRMQCSANLLQFIGGTNVSVEVIKPTKQLEIETLNFTKWPKSNSFILNGCSPSWHDFVKSCGNLHVGDTVRVWTFRLPGGRHGLT